MGSLDSVIFSDFAGSAVPADAPGFLSQQRVASLRAAAELHHSVDILAASAGSQNGG
jgi:hypothetical protein